MLPRRVAAALAGGALLLSLAACSSSGTGSRGSGGAGGSGGSTEAGGSSPAGGSGQPTAIKVALSQDASALDVLVGIDQGFFTKHNLKVTPAFLDNGTTLPQVTGSEYQISSLAATQMIAAASSGLKLTAISANRVDTPQNQTAGVIVRPDSKITSFKDLEGKTVGTPLVNGTLMLCVLELVKQQGGDLTKVKPLQGPTPQLPDLLKAKRFDAITALQPFSAQLVAQGYKNLGDPFRAVGDQTASAVYTTTTSWADSHKGAIADWRAAMQEADDFIAANADKAKQILIDKAKVAPAAVKGTPLATYATAIPTGTLQKWVTIMQDTGALKKPVDVASLTYS